MFGNENSPLLLTSIFSAMRDIFKNGFSLTNKEYNIEYRNQLYQRMSLKDIDANTQHSLPSLVSVPLMHRIHLTRKLMVLPLKKSLYNKYNLNYDYHDSDKCIFPQSVSNYLLENKIGKWKMMFHVFTCLIFVIFHLLVDAPWIFELQPFDHVTRNRDNDEGNNVLDNISVNKSISDGATERASYVSPLSFDNNEAYIYVPPWVMQKLGLKTGDVVHLRYIHLKPLDRVVVKIPTLTKHSYSNHSEETSTPGLVTELEDSLSRFSALTSNSTINLTIGYQTIPNRAGKETQVQFTAFIVEYILLHYSTVVVLVGC